MRPDELPAALAAAGSRVRALGDTLGPEAAQAVLEMADPPRATGALAASGQVVESAVVFGGGTVDYAEHVHRDNPFLDRAVEAAAATVLDLADAHLGEAITL